MTAATRPPALRAWLLATRPKTLTAALAPVAVGMALVYGLRGTLDFINGVLTVLMALLIQVGINLVNDALDFKKGADTAGRLGPARATQQGWFTFQQVMAGGLAAFTLALIVATLLASRMGPNEGVILIAIASVCIVGGYLYTGGPYPLAYLGLSDPAVIFFFGIVATTTTVFIQTGLWSGHALLAGLQMGLLAAVLSAINNLRDIEEDRKAEKLTLAVRFGVSFARGEIGLLCMLPFLLGSVWWVLGRPWAAVAPLAVSLKAWRITKTVMATAPSAAYNDLLGEAAKALVFFGALLAFSLAV